MKLDWKHWGPWIAAALAVVGVKVWLAGVGHQNDFASYMMDVRIMDVGDSIYAHMIGYNYGPVWMETLFALEKITRACGYYDSDALHRAVALFLALCDVALAGCIAVMYGRVASWIFLLNPISILVSGFQSQFDSFAVLLGLLGILIMDKKPASLHAFGREMLAALLLGLSLMTKHFLFLFPVWILFSKTLERREKLILSLLPPLLFLLSFAPWMADPAAREGIAQHVFQYAASEGNTLLSMPLLWLWHHLWPALTAPAKLCRIVFFMALSAAGYCFRRENLRFLFVLYALALVVTTSAISPQYLVMGAFAASVFWRHSLSAVFWIIVTPAMFPHIMLASGGSIFRLAYKGMIMRLVDVFNFIKGVAGGVVAKLPGNYMFAQIPLAVLLITLYVKRKSLNGRSPDPDYTGAP